MKISQVTIDVRDIQSAADYYGSLLGLPVTITEHGAVVQAGRTALILRDNPEAEGGHHLAFTIPSNKFSSSKSWVAQRTEVMSKGGEDEFEYDAGWNARSLYFPGPEDSVMEFIIRRDLGNESSGEFAANDIECISEVGVAVPDVLDAVNTLSTGAGIDPYGLTPRDRFSPVGTIDGLIILVSPNRAWFPADDVVSQQSRVVIDATGARPGTYPFGELSTLVIS